MRSPITSASPTNDSTSWAGRDFHSIPAEDGDRIDSGRPRCWEGRSRHGDDGGHEGERRDRTPRRLIAGAEPGGPSDAGYEIGGQECAEWHGEEVGDSRERRRLRHEQ